MQDMPDPTTRVLLRDGGTVLLRRMTAGDTDGVRALTDALPAPDRPADLTPSGDPRAADTLVAARGEQILGYAGYRAYAATVARMSMVVAPAIRGLGLGTLLLTELSARGDAAGITRFTMQASVDNGEVLHLLCRSGFPGDRPQPTGAGRH
jgi:GNAT superfamily N-acetyltransferase